MNFSKEISNDYDAIGKLYASSHIMTWVYIFKEAPKHSKEPRRATDWQARIYVKVSSSPALNMMLPLTLALVWTCLFSAGVIGQPDQQGKRWDSDWHCRGQ